MELWNLDPFLSLAEPMRKMICATCVSIDLFLDEDYECYLVSACVICISHCVVPNGLSRFIFANTELDGATLNSNF